MTTHHTHHRSTHRHTTTHGPGRDVALRWLAQQLRWERLLTELRDPRAPIDEEEAA